MGVGGERWWAAAAGEAYRRGVALDSSHCTREGAQDGIRQGKIGSGRIVIADGCYVMKRYTKRVLHTKSNGMVFYGNG